MARLLKQSPPCAKRRVTPAGWKKRGRGDEMRCIPQWGWGRVWEGEGATTPQTSGFYLPEEEREGGRGNLGAF